jgi:hypothetical protein
VAASPTLRPKTEPATEVGTDASHVRSAQQRNRLVWVNSLDDSNIWSVPVSGGKPVPVISSTARDRDVATSSSGLLAFRSDRSGYPEICISSRDGKNSRKGSPTWRASQAALNGPRTDAAWFSIRIGGMEPLISTSRSATRSGLSVGHPRRLRISRARMRFRTGRPMERMFILRRSGRGRGKYGGCPQAAGTSRPCR